MKVAAFIAFLASTCCITEAIPPAVKTGPASLLHRAASSSDGSHAVYPEAGYIWPHGGALNPKPQGHMLTDAELAPISNIACLEAKQLDPAVNCSKAVPIALQGVSLPLNAGNYPSWKDPNCHSDGEYLCDPDQLLSTKERANITAMMKNMRKEHLITCGPQLQHDPVDKWHYQPFYLGIAIAPKDWPMYESDSQSLQMFGRILAGRWNMTFPWDGNPAFYARCPTEAMLIIVPEKHQAHLSSPSCTFICEEKGGPEIAAASRLGLDRGVVAGVEAGITEVYKAIAASSPMHKPGWQPVEKTAGTWADWNKVPTVPGHDPSASLEDALWTWGQRILFAVSVVIFIGSLIVAVLVCYLAPGMAKDLNKSVV